MFFCVFFKLFKNNFTYGTPPVIALGFIFGKSLHPFYLTWSTKNIKFSKNISGSIPQNLPETYNSLLLWSNILEACSYEIIGKGSVEVIVMCNLKRKECVNTYIEENLWTSKNMGFYLPHILPYILAKNGNKSQKDFFSNVVQYYIEPSCFWIQSSVGKRP